MASKRIVLLTGLEFAYLRRFMHSFESEKIRFPGKCFLKNIVSIAITPIEHLIDILNKLVQS